MRRLSVRRQELPTLIATLAPRLEQPLYRGLGATALAEYRIAGTQTPRDGDLATGCGVCFTTDPDYALAFSAGVLLVTDQERVARGRTVTDTTQPGYDAPARERLDQELGQGNYDGYRLWAEVQREDTLLSDGPTRHTYIARRTITREDLDYEIILEGDA